MFRAEKAEGDMIVVYKIMKDMDRVSRTLG